VAATANAETILVCPVCRQEVTLQIPVVMTVSGAGWDQRISAEVDNAAPWEQPVWDHYLTQHGPR
jgi:hypothetical protein